MSSAIAIKVSSELAESARLEAEHSDRSLTGQIEHWARLGRSLDALLPVPVAAALKRSGGDLRAIEEAAMRDRVSAAIAAVHGQEHLQHSSAALKQSAGPRYEVDPSDPKRIVQVLPDGSRVQGKFVDRKFVPKV
jgi:hypothetical protein